MIVFKFLIFALVSGLQGSPVNDKNLVSSCVFTQFT